MDPHFFQHFVNLWAYGISGILLICFGYKVFDFLTPRIHFTNELVDKQNVAVGIVVASIILGVSAIAVAVIAS